MVTKTLKGKNHIPWACYYIHMGASVKDLDTTPWVMVSAVAFLWAIGVVMVTYTVIKRRW